MNEIFEELIANTKKKTWIQYLQDDMQDEKEQIIKGLEFERELETKFREKMDSNEIDVKHLPQDLLEWADKELLSGNVAAVDGTEVLPIELISGFFCQVGVGGISYTNTDPKINVQSITSHIDGETTAGEYFNDLISGKKKITKIDKNAARSYWELECCINRDEPWVFKDGPAIPRELLDFPEGIKLLDNESLKRIIGVVKGSKSLDYRLLGRFLKNNEYIIVEGVGDFYRDMKMKQQRDWMNITKDFFNYADKFKRGVFRAHTKSYIFEIHEDHLEKGVALVMADSMKSPRGLPCLLDLVDTKLRELFENNFYKEKMYSFLMEKSQKDLLENIDERELRY